MANDIKLKGWLRACGLGLLACVAVGQVHAQSVMGLSDAYAHALANDATLRAARAQADGVAERLEQAKAQLRPNVSLGLTRYKNDLAQTQPNVLGQSVTNDLQYYSHSQTLQLRQPLYRPALTLGVDVASAQVDDGQAVLAREVQNTGVRVVESYLQVLLAQDREALLRVQYQLTLKQLDSARKRLEAGQGIRTDVDEAQARLDLLDAQLLEAGQSRQTALLQLRMLTQQPLTGVRPLQVGSPAPGRFDAQTPDVWMAKALAGSPEIRALQARVEAAKLDVQRMEAGHKPTLDAVIQVNRSGSENVTSPNSSYLNRQIGLQFNMPLYSGGGQQSAVRQALAEQVRLQESLEALRRDLEVRVQREWRGVTEGALRASAMERAVASADQVVVSVRRSFDAGFRTVLDVLNAEQQAQQARRDLSEARLTYVASRLRLLSLAGDLDAEQMQVADGWLVPPT